VSGRKAAEAEDVAVAAAVVEDEKIVTNRGIGIRTETSGKVDVMEWEEVMDRVACRWGFRLFRCSRGCFRLDSFRLL
jgi:hypothetical protein